MNAPPPAPAPAELAEAAAALKAARRGRAGIDRAVRFGRFSGWTLAVLGGLSGLSVLGSASGGLDLPSLLLTVAMGTLAGLEFAGSVRLGRLDPAGAAGLARNQLLLGALILLWCGYRVATASSGESPYAEVIAGTPELGAMLGDVDGLVRELTLLVYGAAGVVGVAFQGLAWRFHRRRVAMVERYLADTPAWAREG